MTFVVVVLGFSTQTHKAEYLAQANFIIAIDIGHTKERPGAISARGIGEFYFNQNIAKLLYRELNQHGFMKAFIINEEGGNIILKERIQIAKEHNAHVLISIHHDSVQPQYLSSWNNEGTQLRYSDLFEGYSIFYSEKNAEAKKVSLLLVY